MKRKKKREIKQDCSNLVATMMDKERMRLIDERNQLLVLNKLLIEKLNK